jgi:hypothetical protein
MLNNYSPKFDKEFHWFMQLVNFKKLFFKMHKEEKERGRKEKKGAEGGKGKKEGKKEGRERGRDGERNRLQYDVLYFF